MKIVKTLLNLLFLGLVICGIIIIVDSIITYKDCDLQVEAEVIDFTVFGDLQLKIESDICLYSGHVYKEPGEKITVYTNAQHTIAIGNKFNYIVRHIMLGIALIGISTIYLLIIIKKGDSHEEQQST